MSAAHAISFEAKSARPSAFAEWDVLRYALGAPNSAALMRGVLTRSIDWQIVLDLADAHGASPLLYQKLSHEKDLVPSSVLEMLRRRYQNNVHKSLFLARELARILDCAESVGIELVAYKGVVLAENYYNDMALREAGDIDLFIRKPDVAVMKNAICGLGYTPRNFFPQNFEHAYFESGYECAFDSPAGQNLLELHWALQPHFYAVDYDMEEIFERSVRLTTAGRDVKTPSPEDLLLILSVHAAKHVWEKLIWLCDIAQILRRENLNWDVVLSLARASGILRILQITMLLAHRFMEIPIPVPVEATIRDQYAVRGLVEEIAASVIAGTLWEEKKISYFRLMMRLRERPADRLRFLARLTFTPGPGEWQFVRLPKILSPFYPAVRVGRLVARFAHRSKTNQRLANPPAVSPPSSV
jgi:hypothetical protein